MKTGAAAVFDEKYGDQVRVIRWATSAPSSAAVPHVLRDRRHRPPEGRRRVLRSRGFRRIEAVAGREAVKYVEQIEEELKKTAELLKAGHAEVSDRVEKLLKHQRDLEKEIEALKGKLAAKDSADLMDRVREIKGGRVLAAQVDAPDVKTLRDFGDKVRDKLDRGSSSWAAAWATRPCSCAW